MFSHFYFKWDVCNTYILLTDNLLTYLLLTHINTNICLPDIDIDILAQVSITGNRVERLQAYVFPPLLSLKVIFPHSSKSYIQ